MRKSYLPQRAAPIESSEAAEPTETHESPRSHPPEHLSGDTLPTSTNYTGSDVRRDPREEYEEPDPSYEIVEVEQDLELQDDEPQASPARIARCVEHVELPDDQTAFPEPAEELPPPEPSIDLEEQNGPLVFPSKTGGGTINGHRFAAEYAHDNAIKFDKARGWMEYDAATGKWSQIEGCIVMKRIGYYVRQKLKSLGLGDLQSQITYDRIEDITRLARGEAFTTFKPNCFPGVLHFRNTMLDTNIVPFVELPFDPKYCSVNQIPYDFDPRAKCPRYMRWLDETMSSDDQLTWAIWNGMVLSGTNTWQKIMILQGIGNSSKSQHSKVIQGLIGSENVFQFEAQNLGNRFEMNKLIDKTLLVGSDVDSEFLAQAAAHKLKALTGEDTISAELKFKNGSINMECLFNVLMVCNSTLRVRLEGDLEAWSRRLILIEFTNQVRNRIPHFARTILAEEASGILNLFLKGLLIMRKHGLHLTPAQQLRVNNLLEECDSVRKFVEKQVVLDPEDSLTTDELVRAHERFCAARGWASGSPTIVTKQLHKILAEFYKLRERHDLGVGCSRRGFSGIALGPEPVLPDQM